MMTDKQQIEKFATDLCKACSLKTCKNEYPPCVKAEWVSEALYKAGYRKVDANAVVLTREEFDRLNSCIKSEEEVRAIMEQQMLPMVRELTDKEMSKKIDAITALAFKETVGVILGNIKTLTKQGWEMSQIEKWICLNYGVVVEDV